MTRKQPNLREMLATALLQIPEHGIDFEEAKGLTAQQVIAKFELHHHVHVALGGENTPALMSWMPKAEHRQRTAKIDVPAIAKIKRGLKKRIAGRTFNLDEPTYSPTYSKTGKVTGMRKWPTRKMGSKTHRKKMDGSVVEKKR